MATAASGSTGGIGRPRNSHGAMVLTVVTDKPVRSCRSFCRPGPRRHRCHQLRPVPVPLAVVPLALPGAHAPRRSPAVSVATDRDVRGRDRFILLIERPYRRRRSASFVARPRRRRGHRRDRPRRGSRCPCRSASTTGRPRPRSRRSRRALPRLRSSCPPSFDHRTDCSSSATRSVRNCNRVRSPGARKF